MRRRKRPASDTSESLQEHWVVRSVLPSTVQAFHQRGVHPEVFERLYTASRSPARHTRKGTPDGSCGESSAGQEPVNLLAAKPP